MMNHTQASSGQAVRRIVSAFVTDEEGFLDAVREAGRQEPTAEAGERFLRLADLPEFQAFFAWLSRREPSLTLPCRWLVFGPKLAPDAQDPPNFGELQRLIQRVRECRPDFSDFFHQMLAESVLTTVAEPALPTGVAGKPARRFRLPGFFSGRKWRPGKWPFPVRFTGCESSGGVFL